MAETAVGATRRLASLAVSARLDDVSAEGVENAKLVVLDTLGVMIAAQTFAVGQQITRYVGEVGGGHGAPVVGSGVRAPLPLAALANGTLAHGLDFDDHKHLSTHTLPAALALASSGAASGRDVLEAFVVGREVGARLGALLEARRKEHRGPTYRGWYRVGVVGPIASAVSAGRLLGLDDEAMADAIGVAASSASGLRRNQGTMAKALHSGNAASAGVTAAQLAAHGFSGDREILESPLGLVNALCLPGEEDWSALDGFGRPYDVDKHLGIKPYPACSPSHMPLDALLGILEHTAIDVDRIESVEADLHPFSLMRAEPTEAIATGYSLPFLLAVALLDGAVGLDQVSEERLADPAVRELMDRVRHDPAAAPAGGPERVRVRLAGGAVLEGQVPEKRSLQSREAIVAKFEDCASRVLVADQVAALRDEVLRLDEAADLGRLTELSTPREPGRVRRGPGPRAGA